MSPSRSLLATLVLVASASPAAADGPRVTMRMADSAEERAAVVTAVAIGPRGETIAAAGDDHRVRLWNAADGRRLRTLEGHHDWVRGVRFAPDGERLATVADDSTLRFWDLRSAGAPALRRLSKADGPLRAVGFAAGGDRVATAGYKARLRVFDTGSGAEVNDFDCACGDTTCLAFSPRAGLIAVAGRSGAVRLWDTDSSGPPVDLPGDGRRVRTLAFSPSGAVLAAAGDGPAVRLWRVEPLRAAISPSMPIAGDGLLEGEILTRPGKTHALAFLGDELLAVGGTADVIRLYDTESRSQRGELRGHTGAVAALDASADGRVLVSGAFDATVRVWSIDERLLDNDRFAARPESAAR